MIATPESFKPSSQMPGASRYQFEALPPGETFLVWQQTHALASTCEVTQRSSAWYEASARRGSFAEVVPDGFAGK